MTTTLKRTAVAFALAGIVAGSLAPRLASAHPELTPDELDGNRPVHLPGPPRNIRVSFDELPRRQVRLTIRVNLPDGDGEGAPVYVSWDPGHSHSAAPIYVIRLLKHPADTFEAANRNCADDRARRIGDCPLAAVRSGARNSVLAANLDPETTYYVYVSQNASRGIHSAGPRNFAAASFTTPPGTRACTYEHRIVGVPGTTGDGYIGRVWVSSKRADATATIRAYQGDNGHALELLDGDGQPIGPVVSLSPANSIKQFRTEGAQGWHVVTVTHATARAMHSASVVLRIRGPDGVQNVPIPSTEHCETASTPAQ